VGGHALAGHTTRLTWVLTHVWEACMDDGDVKDVGYTTPAFRSLSGTNNGIAGHVLGGAWTAEVFLDDVPVPDEALVGGQDGHGTGYLTAMRCLAHGRLHIAPLCAGMAQRLLEETVSYALARTQSGQPIAEFQLVQGLIADSQTDCTPPAPWSCRPRRTSTPGPTPGWGRPARSTSPPRPSAGSPTAPSRSTAASATCAASPSSASTATPASSASTKAPARSSKS
jgi:hypothetical protein